MVRSTGQLLNEEYNQCHITTVVHNEEQNKAETQAIKSEMKSETLSMKSSDSEWEDFEIIEETFPKPRITSNSKTRSSQRILARQTADVPSATDNLASSEQQELMITVTIGGQQVKAKVDTGSRFSCMNLKLANSLRGMASVKIQPHGLNTVQEEVTTVVKLDRKTVELRALVLPPLRHDLILGMDFLNAAQAIFICAGHKIQLGQANNEAEPEDVAPPAKQARLATDDVKILPKKKTIKATDSEREYQRAYRERNRQMLQEYQRQYREMNKQLRHPMVKEYHRNYRQQNSQKIRQYREHRKQKSSQQ